MQESSNKLRNLQNIIIRRYTSTAEDFYEAINRGETNTQKIVLQNASILIDISLQSTVEVFSLKIIKFHKLVLQNYLLIQNWQE